MSNNNVVSHEVDSWCRTKPTEKVTFKFTWTIENFTARPEATWQSLCSSIFHVKGADGYRTDWKIELYSRGEDDDAINFLSVYVCNETDIDVTAKSEVSILDSAGRKHYITKIDGWKMFQKDQVDFGAKKWLSIDTLDTLIPQN